MQSELQGYCFSINISTCFGLLFILRQYFGFFTKKSCSIFEQSIDKVFKSQESEKQVDRIYMHFDFVIYILSVSKKFQSLKRKPLTNKDSPICITYQYPPIKQEQHIHLPLYLTLVLYVEKSSRDFSLLLNYKIQKNSTQLNRMPRNAKSQTETKLCSVFSCPFNIIPGN